MAGYSPKNHVGSTFVPAVATICGATKCFQHSNAADQHIDSINISHFALKTLSGIHLKHKCVIVLLTGYIFAKKEE